MQTGTDDLIDHDDTRTSDRSSVPLGPESLTWRYGNDWRGVLAARSTIWLEVAHPVVGAGVGQHSRFDTDRWGTLSRRFHTMFALYGGHTDAGAVAAAEHLRAVHSTVKGVDTQGRSYHALNADAYLWVAATGYSMQADIRRVFDGVVDETLEDGLYEEWKRTARVLGVPERVIPATRTDFWSYYWHVIDDILERNLCTDRVLDVDSRPLPRHPSFRGPTFLWNLGARPFQKLIVLSGAGLLPPQTRRLLGIPWNSRRQNRFDRLIRIVRWGDRVLPDKARYPFRRVTPSPTLPDFFVTRPRPDRTSETQGARR
ncbi:oxygenase MpaB family protein [Gordonia sp. CPCC 206044]|uniref:oxygenase MpaB family protein n=1 Tax=Gordonia sp. CPCC 206044 TaxID=3140793 RepID=UPI003AF36A02